MPPIRPRGGALVAATAAAIHHVHQRGILHRDLKPANVLVDARGEPHVTDFGLAKRVEGGSELTISGVIMGTPGFMAPEQASGGGGAVTTQTDVYCLGATPYALLAGRSLFGGAQRCSRRSSTCASGRPNRPGSSTPRVPRDLVLFRLKRLEKDPRQRYAKAQTLAEACGGSWRVSRSRCARWDTPMRPPMWCRREPVCGRGDRSGGRRPGLRFDGRDHRRAVIEGARHQEQVARVEAETNFEMAQQAVEAHPINVSENTLLKQQDSLDIRSLRQDPPERRAYLLRAIRHATKKRPAAPGSNWPRPTFA